MHKSIRTSRGRESRVAFNLCSPSDSHVMSCHAFSPQSSPAVAHSAPALLRFPSRPSHQALANIGVRATRRDFKFAVRDFLASSNLPAVSLYHFPVINPSASRPARVARKRPTSTLRSQAELQTTIDQNACVSHHDVDTDHLLPASSWPAAAATDTRDKIS